MNYIKIDKKLTAIDPEKALIDIFVQRGSIFTLIGYIFITLPILILSIAVYVVVFWV